MVSAGTLEEDLIPGEAFVTKYMCDLAGLELSY